MMNIVNKLVYIICLIVVIGSMSNAQEGKSEETGKNAKSYLQGKTRKELYQEFKLVAGSEVGGMFECARFYREANMNKEAIEVYNEIIDGKNISNGDKGTARRDLAFLFFKLKNYDKSISYCNDILNNPTAHELTKSGAYDIKVDDLLELKKYQEAIETIKFWNELVKKSKQPEMVYPFGKSMPGGEHFSAKQYLAIIYQAQGKYEDAIKVRREIIEWVEKSVSPDKKRGRGYESYFGIEYLKEIGNCYKEMKKYNLALEEYKKALTNTNNDAILGHLAKDKEWKNQKIQELGKLIEECKQKIK